MDKGFASIKMVQDSIDESESFEHCCKIFQDKSSCSESMAKEIVILYITLCIVKTRAEAKNN